MLILWLFVSPGHQQPWYLLKGDKVWSTEMLRVASPLGGKFTICLGVHQRKHQSSAWPALSEQFHPRSMDSFHKRPVRQSGGKCFHIMTSSWNYEIHHEDLLQTILPNKHWRFICIFYRRCSKCKTPQFHWLRVQLNKQVDCFCTIDVLKILSRLHNEIRFTKKLEFQEILKYSLYAFIKIPTQYLNSW